MVGRIFDISEFCLHDGPGIRTTVFFKGCPLRCQWCHNPEGQSFDKEIMISVNKCSGCGRCREVCVSPAHCIGCGKCVSVCPMRLRKICGIDITADDLAVEVSRNADVFSQSGGGVTLSGGEPLSQSEFLMELLPKIQHLHVVLDTCGYAPNNVFIGVISLCALVLFDIKHLDSDIHKEYTGVGNELILSNLDLLIKSSVPFIARVPLIPGVNDNDDFLEALCKHLAGVSNLIKVEFLPYNRGAGAKYPMLGRPYNITFDSEKRPYKKIEIFNKYNIGVSCYE